MQWEPHVRTQGRNARSDLQRLAALADPRRTLYRNAHYLAATVAVDAAQMQPWLPPGIRLTEPARADVFTAYFPDCNYGSIYHEAGIFVHIKTRGGKTGIHCPWMILDDDVALILGRELLGYPKKLGDIDWQHNATDIHATASRRGTALLTMGGRLGEEIAGAPPILGRPHRNVSTTAGLFVPWILAFTPTETPIQVRRIADFALVIGGSERDPIDQMGLGEVIDARLHRVDLGSRFPPTRLRPLTPAFPLTRMRPRVL